MELFSLHKLCRKGSASLSVEYECRPSNLTVLESQLSKLLLHGVDTCKYAFMKGQFMSDNYCENEQLSIKCRQSRKRIFVYFAVFGRKNNTSLSPDLASCKESLIDAQGEYRQVG